MPAIDEAAILDEPFAPSAIVPPTIALQLQSLVTAAVAPLLEEIADLKAEIATLKAEKATSAPPTHTDPPEDLSPQQITPPPDTAISENIIQLRTDLENYNESRASEIAQDRRRIAALEVPDVVARPTTSKTTAHIQDIRALLMTPGHRRVTVKFLASRLELTKRRAWQIIHMMEGDGLVNLVWDPHHKGRKLVELRKLIGTRSEI